MRKTNSAGRVAHANKPEKRCRLARQYFRLRFPRPPPPCSRPAADQNHRCRLQHQPDGPTHPAYQGGAAEKGKAVKRSKSVSIARGAFGGANAGIPFTCSASVNADGPLSRARFRAPKRPGTTTESRGMQYICREDSLCPMTGQIAS